MTRAYRPWFLAGVLLTCMCGLMLQIMETRVLSVIGHYNLAFFAIGVAMLGMTAGALLVFYRFEADVFRRGRLMRGDGARDVLLRVVGARQSRRAVESRVWYRTSSRR